MFGALDAFRDENYFDTHKYGKLTTDSGREYSLSLFAVLETDAREKTVFEPGDGAGLLPLLRRKARIFREPGAEGDGGKRILGMSTCTGSLNDDRLVVFGILSDCGG